MKVVSGGGERIRFGIKGPLLGVVLPIIWTIIVAFLLFIVLTRDNRQHTMQLMDREFKGLDRELAFLERDVARLATDSVLINALADPKIRKSTLPDLIERFASGVNAKAFVLTDPEGALIFAHRETLANYNELPNLKEVLTTGKTASHLDLVREIYVVAVPVYYFQNIFGIVVCGFDFKTIFSNHMTDGSDKPYRIVIGEQRYGFGDGVVDSWESMPANVQMPFLYRFGAILETGTEKSHIAAVVLKSAGLVFLLSIVLAIVVLIIAYREFAKIQQTVLTIPLRTGRLGRERGLVEIPPSETPKEAPGLLEGGIGRAELDLDRAHWEEMLRERTQERDHAREFFRLVTEAIPGRVFWKDCEGIYLGCNEAFARDAGLADCESVQKLRERDMPWGELAGLHEDIEKTVMGEDCPLLEREAVLQVFSGESISISISRMPIKDGDGKVMGIIGVYWQTEKISPENATAERRRIAMLEVEMRKFADVLRQCPSMMMIVDPRGKIEYVNESLCTASGYTIAEILGQNVLLLDGGLDGDPEERWRTMTSGGSFQGEWRNRKKGGEYFWVSSMVAPIRAKDGEVSHYFLVGDDISSRKEMAQRWRENELRIDTLFQILDIGIWERDWKMGEMVLSWRCWQMFGLDAGQRNIDWETWWQRIHPEDRTEVDAQLQRHFSGEIGSYRSEQRMCHEDGRWLWVRERGQVCQWSSEGKPVRMVCTVVDISAHQRGDLQRGDRVEEDHGDSREKELSSSALAALTVLPQEFVSIKEAGPSEGVVAAPSEIIETNAIMDPVGEAGIDAIETSETIVSDAQDVLGIQAPLDSDQNGTTPLSGAPTKVQDVLEHETISKIVIVTEESASLDTSNLRKNGMIAIQSAEVAHVEDRPLTGSAPVIHHSRNKPFPSVPGWDSVAGLGNVGGNEALYRNLLIGFCEKNYTLTERMRDMLSKSRYDRIGKEVMDIQGVLLELGALKLHDQAVALEGALRGGKRKRKTVDHYFNPFCQSMDMWMGVLRGWAVDEVKGGNHREPLKEAID